MIILRVLCVSLLCCFGMVQASIYETVNADGSVSYSDTPTSSEAKPVKLKPLSVSKVPKGSLPTLSSELAQPAGSGDQAAKAAKAATVQIVQPKSGATFWNQNEIEVMAAVTPSLQPNQAIRLLVNGKEAGKNGSGRFTVQYLQRGEQVFQAQVIGQGGGVLSQSQPVKVFIHRTSVKKYKFVKP